ncbi:MAG: hypothetical protein E7589_00635 [Ruminococcaceae bacterium]|nr:hypothetical protein [Oscillospiraceae bacterium]
MAAKKNKRLFSEREEKKLTNTLQKAISKDKQYKKTVKGMNVTLSAQALSLIAGSAARAVVKAANTNAEKKKSGFDVYCDLVSAFAKVRKKSQKARLKAGKYNKKTGLTHLSKIPKVKKAKRNKAYKIRKIKK